MKKKIIAFALMIVLALQCIPVAAADRATFINTRETSPHLYVTKTVTTTNGYKIPDVTFNFTIKVNNAAYEKQEYRVFDSEGEVFNYSSGESHEVLPNKIPYKTTMNGDFTLKGGQTAQFEYVGTGKAYEITESPTENFTQTKPAAGTSAKGTVAAEGSSEEFINTYVPVDETKKTTTLEVSKDIMFPTGYTKPEAPSFSFSIQLEGKAYGNEAFTIIDTASQVSKGEGTTDGAGAFSLNEGETARFMDVPVDVDYVVEEKAEDGWRVIGEATREGATIAPLTSISYTNTNVSFGVSKRLTDNSVSEDAFTFFLTDNMQNAIPEAQYYLYNASGNRVDETVHKTAEDGSFELKANQAAIFIGIAPETIYNVSEKGLAGYVQTLPTSNTGYTNKEVSDSFEMLPFVNEAKDLTGALAVTKTVTGADGLPLANEYFTFVLSNKAGSDYIVLPDTIYSISVGTKTETYKTNSEGIFSLKRNETAVFEGLDKAEYKVEEINLTSEYSNDDLVQTGTLEETLAFTFENKYSASSIDLTILKSNKSGTTLKNAKFDLYADTELTNKVNDEAYKTNDEGKILFEDIKTGIYYLKEIESPLGYQLLTNPIKIEFLRDGKDLKVNIDGLEYTETSSNGFVTFEKEDSVDKITVKVINERGFNLPITGGIGLPALFIAIGLLGLIVSSLFLFKKRKGR
ncbi:hypothetical protein M2146_001153 [Lachnospiraceae bacterium PF1-22]